MRRQLVETVVKALNGIGFNLEYNDETAQKIVDAESKVESLLHSGKFDDAISKLDDVDFISKEKSVEVAMNPALSDKEFEDMLASQRKVRELYLSMAKPKR